MKKPKRRQSSDTQYSPPRKGDDLDDSRRPWDWKSRYPTEARKEIDFEALVLAFGFVIFLIIAAVTLGATYSRGPVSLSFLWLIPITIDLKWLAIFFCGMVGGISFSIKWLIHSVATGRWHLDRRYWRFLSSSLGGVYACVVLVLFDAGILSGLAKADANSLASIAALAFLVGYFSDGVSGLLSNIANAVFGTVEKK